MPRTKYKTQDGEDTYNSGQDNVLKKYKEHIDSSFSKYGGEDFVRHGNFTDPDTGERKPAGYRLRYPGGPRMAPMPPDDRDEDTKRRMRRHGIR